ncbi:hypothetical protein [Nostoc sp. CCY 9925]
MFGAKAILAAPLLMSKLSPGKNTASEMRQGRSPFLSKTTTTII